MLMNYVNNTCNISLIKTKTSNACYIFSLKSAIEYNYNNKNFTLIVSDFYNTIRYIRWFSEKYYINNINNIFLCKTFFPNINMFYISNDIHDIEDIYKFTEIIETKYIILNITSNSNLYKSDKNMSFLYKLNHIKFKNNIPICIVSNLFNDKNISLEKYLFINSNTKHIVDFKLIPYSKYKNIV